MVFQQYHLIGRLSALDNVLTGRLAAHGALRSMFPLPRADRLLALEALDRVGLADRALHRADQLSGGQQQRVGIARGLILKPRLVIADEPVSALDASVQAQILNLLAELKRQYELTLILISHSLCAIHYLCTHISVLYGGRLVEEAPAAIFFGEPKHPYSKALLDATLVLDPSKPKDSRTKKENNASPPNPRSGCAFHPYCSHRLPICARQAPDLKEVKRGERVACFLHNQESEK